MRTHGNVHLAGFLDRLRSEICRQPAATVTMRRAVEPGKIGPSDMLLPLRGLDMGRR
jgi:hypothetical protein